VVFLEDLKRRVRRCPRCGRPPTRVFVRTIKGRQYVIARHYVRSVMGTPRYHEWSLGPYDRAPPEVLELLERMRSRRGPAPGPPGWPRVVAITREEALAFKVFAVHRLSRSRFKQEKWGISWEELKQAWNSLKAKLLQD